MQRFFHDLFPQEPIDPERPYLLTEALEATRGYRRFYLDASAFVRSSSNASRSHGDLEVSRKGASWSSSELLVTEVPRALRGSPERPDIDLAFSLGRPRLSSGRPACIRSGDSRYGAPGRNFEPELRSLDAIHVMTALEIRPIEVFLSYDLRQLKAAAEAGLPTVSPGMKW